MRLRQIVIAAPAISPLAEQLTTIFGLGEPYRDPGVGEFGLENVVYAIGDQFLEIVAPTRADTAAGRFLARWGPGGYMVLLQTDNLAGLRARADAQAIRRVWNIDLPDIAASHLHPRDIGGAILSVDRPDPPESWRWGGPDWAARRGEGLVKAVRGVVFQSPQPDRLAARWADLLACPHQAGGSRIALADAWLDYVSDTDGRGEGVCAYRLGVTDMAAILTRSARAGLETDAHSVHLPGLRLELEAA
jgi:hypothetical protein